MAVPIQLHTSCSQPPLQPGLCHWAASPRCITDTEISQLHEKRNVPIPGNRTRAGNLDNEREGTHPSLKIHHLWQLVLTLKRTMIAPGVFSEEKIILTKIRIFFQKYFDFVETEARSCLGIFVWGFCI